jgi:DNA-binding MarR family transcriptional regulator
MNRVQDNPESSVDERERLIGQCLDSMLVFSRCMHRGVPRPWLEAEITMSQFKTLLVLYGMEKASMGELADALGTGVSTVTGIVDRLVDHGLVVREEDPRDRRVVVARPTATGLALVDRLMLAARDRLSRVLSPLSVEELRMVSATLQILGTSALCVFAATAPASGLRSG